MSTKDIHLFENGSGGEIFINNGDLVLSETLTQTIYIALFGGNIEQDTEGNEIQGVERLDWWGNELFYPQSQNKWFNSITERALNNTTLNSSGRQIIEQAVKDDLQFLSNVAEVEVSVSIIKTNQISITVSLTKLSNQENRTLELVYDNFKDEVILKRTI